MLVRTLHRLKPSAYPFIVRKGLGFSKVNETKQSQALNSGTDFTNSNLKMIEQSFESILQRAKSNNLPDIALLEEVLSVNERYENLLNVNKQVYKTLLDQVPSLMSQLERGPMVKILCRINKFIKDSKVAEYLIKLIKRNDVLDKELIAGLNVKEQVRLAGVLYDCSCKEYALEVIKEHVLPCGYIDQEVIRQLLSLPSPLLKEIGKPLENILRETAIRALTLKECLETIKQILDIYDNPVADIINKYFHYFINSFSEDFQINDSQANDIADTINELYIKAPHCLLQERKTIFVPLLFTLRELINNSELSFDCKKRIENAFLLFDDRAYIIEELYSSTPAMLKLSNNTLTENINQLQKVLNESNYVFDIFSYNKFYMRTFNDLLEKRNSAIYRLNSTLIALLSDPHNHHQQLIKILADPSVKSLIKIMKNNQFDDIANLIINDLPRSKELTQPNFYSDYLNIINTFIITKPESLLNIPTKTFVENYRLTDKNYLKNLSKYVNIVFNPCMNDIPYYENAREILCNSKIAESLQMVNIIGCGEEGVEKSWEFFKYLIPIYTYLGNEEVIKNFTDGFYEFPSEFLSLLDPEELRQLLLLFIKSNVVW